MKGGKSGGHLNRSNVWKYDADDLQIYVFRNQPSISSSVSAAASSNPTPRPWRPNTTATRWSAGKTRCPSSSSSPQYPQHPPFFIPPLSQTSSREKILANAQTAFSSYAHLPPPVTNFTFYYQTLTLTFFTI